MVSRDGDHPTEQRLRDYLDGRLDEEAARSIDDHLVSCEQCNTILGGFDQDGPLVRLIQSAWPSDESDRPLNPGEDTDGRAQLTEPIASRGSQRAVHRIGKYRIVDELGRGGMGVVYRAFDLELKREVALKVIVSGEHSSKAMRTRFQREAETIARLKHNGIVQIYDVGAANGQPYLALELVTGLNLGDLTDAQPQDPAWASAMVLQLAQAVHFAHSQSVIHRDLKPGNVLVMLDETFDLGGLSSSSHSKSGDSPVPLAKITDFGLAKQLDSDSQVTKTGNVLGTPAYMAPEQASGTISAIGPATDVYALGVILYELLTGRTPFQGHDSIGTLLAVIEAEPESPRHFRPDVPRDLETICLKCLIKSPEQRYASARELATDLELFLAGEPISASAPGPFQRLHRWVRHNPRLAVCYLTCLAIFALHLVAKHVLHQPFHTGEFANFAPMLIAGWGIAVTISEILSRRFEQSNFAQYGLLGITVPVVMIAFTFDQGPQSAPIPMLFVLVGCSILFVPRAAMVAFVTSLSSISYILLVAHANYVTRRGIVSIEQAAGFVISLVLMGFCTYLVLRRAENRTV
ncbi:MAG: protein kinase, partial [Planctomycetota bacterium]